MNDEKFVNILTCREGYESTLAAESGGCGVEASGFVECSGPLPMHSFIFERQRITDAVSQPLSLTRPLSKQMAKSMLQQVLDVDTLWTTHAWSADPDQQSRVQGVERALIHECKKLDTGSWKCWRKAEKLQQRNTGLVVQLFRSGQVLWTGTSEVAALCDPFVGGIRRMKMDPVAPSRSYLKMEEALSYLGIEPESGQTVVDLGAAPGGWSWSFLKRGCHVTSVDNGPIKIENPGVYGGQLEHVRLDGITFIPDAPVDWMVCDMLIPPGQVIGMLRKWIEKRLARHLIFNVKLPHQEPYAGLVPLMNYLEDTVGDALRLKQLYHDRREVTCFGTLNA